MILDKNYKYVLAGTFTLLIAMGLSRFAYTPIFPVMQVELGFSDQFAGWLASINYAGYLLGSVLAAYWAWGDDRSLPLKGVLFINILSIILMGVSQSHIFWYILRFIAGLTAGLAFVLISGIIMDFLTEKSLTHLTGLFYAGVGSGIFLGGLTVPWLAEKMGWRGAWYGVGAMALSLGILVFIWLKGDHPASKTSQATSQIQDEGHQIPLTWLTIAYTTEGIGYIISGTFLVAIVSNIPGFDSYSAAMSWAFVGLAAAPSAMIWVKLANRFGKIPMLRLAYIIQIIGIGLPLLFPNNIGAFLGAMLFGGTFMGITTLTVAAAKLMYPDKSTKIIGQLTFFYAGGQILGPIIAGYLTEISGNYKSTIIFASLVLFTGVLALIFGERRKA